MATPGSYGKGRARAPEIVRTIRIAPFLGHSVFMIAAFHRYVGTGLDERLHALEVAGLEAIRLIPC
ncbi:MAG TPA: hypothetical protein VGG06_21395 [Thermoanaerobaculia bacterium]